MFIRIETLASTCTLVADIFYQRLQTVPSDTVAHLLRGKIVIKSCAGRIPAQKFSQCFRDPSIKWHLHLYLLYYLYGDIDFKHQYWNHAELTPSEIAIGSAFEVFFLCVRYSKHIITIIVLKAEKISGRYMCKCSVRTQRCNEPITIALWWVTTYNF